MAKKRKSRKKPWEQLSEAGRLRRLSGSQYYSQYKQERARIRRLSQKLERQGYIPTQEIMPKVVKSLGRRNIAALQKIDEQYIKDRSDLVDLETGERKKAARVRARKRPTKAQAVATAEEQIPNLKVRDIFIQSKEQSGWEREQRRKDEENRKRMQEEEEYRKQFERGRMTEDSVDEILSRLETTHPNSVAVVRRKIDEAIARHAGNKTEVYNRIADFPEIDSIEDLFYRDYDWLHAAVFNEFVAWIGGSPLSAQEQREVGEAAELDSEGFDIDERYTD